MKSICVFSGSNSGARADYIEAARQLGREIATREMELVYGGSRIGLMAAVADGALNAGGHVVGVIPETLVKREIAHTALSELHVVGSMHERKALMADRADGFVALPGGMGTLDELCEILTWAQLGLHSKPCGLLNICGYYETLLAFFAQMVQERFLHPATMNFIQAATTPPELLARFESYVPKPLEKWI